MAPIRISAGAAENWNESQIHFQQQKKKILNFVLIFKIFDLKKYISFEFNKPKKVLTLAGIEPESPHLPICSADHSATESNFFKNNLFSEHNNNNIMI